MNKGKRIEAGSFYDRRLWKGLQVHSKMPYEENLIPGEVLDRIHCASSEDMSELPDKSVHLVVTSPPYNVGKEYDEDLTLGEYRSFLSRVWAECYRVLVLGGRLCVNIANVGHKPYVPLTVFVTQDLIDLQFIMRGEIIWDKGNECGGVSSKAWGSWCSAKNPILRDIHESILVFSKGSLVRILADSKVSTISKEEFLECTKSIWRFGTVSSRRIGHPAPFPGELPAKLIQLFSYKGEVVLDPFMGSGQTAIAARKAERHFVGYEIDPKYVKLANHRIKWCMQDKFG